MRRAAFAVATCAALLMPAVAGAATPYPQELTCPLGGEKFSVVRTASQSTFGQRLDGKLYTSWQSPEPLAICPNGFILFDAPERFTKERLARIAPIVSSADYQQLLKAGPSYAALAYLYAKLDEGLEAVSFATLQASWQVDTDRAAYDRYQRAFADEAERLLREKDEAWPGYWTVLAFAANARRVTGDFAGAGRLLASVRTDAIPEASRAGWEERYKLLAMLVERRDTAIAPEEALPRMLRERPRSEQTPK